MDNSQLFPEGVLNSNAETLIKMFELFVKRTETQNVILSEINTNTKSTVDFFKDREGMVKLLVEVMNDSSENLEKQMEDVRSKIERLEELKKLMETIKNGLEMTKTAISDLGKYLILRISLIIIGGTSAFAAIVYLIQMFLK
jgi:ElaB/YqjD/DUF883 family membrane-anchored ribosome-binding protein